MRPDKRASFLAAGFAIVVLGLVGTGTWSPTPSPSPVPVPQVPVWGDIAGQFGADTSLLGFDLWAGTLDGTPPVHVTASLDEPLAPPKALTRALPFVSRPTGTLLAYGFFDGQTSELRVIDVATGVDRLVARKPVVYHHAAVASDGTVFALVLDPASRVETGLFAFRDGEAARLVVGARDLPFRAMSGSRLGLLPSGLLVVEDCTFSGCTIRIYQPNQVAELNSLAIGNASVLGFDETTIAIAPFCNLACGRQVLAVPSLEAMPIGRSCGPAAYAVVGGVPAIVSGSRGDCSADGADLIAQWANGGRRTVGTPQLAGLTLVQPSRNSVIGLPPGWVLLTESGTLGVDERGALLDVNGGRVIEIRISRPEA